MNRRQLLHALSVGALTAGCLGAPEEQSPTESATRRQSTPSPTSTPPPTASPRDATPTETSTETDTETATPTQETARDDPVCLGGGETRLTMGESYESEVFVVTPKSLELTETFRLDDTRTRHEVSGDRQLAIADIQLEVVEDRFTWSAGNLPFVRESCTVEEPILTFDHPEQGEIRLSDLERIEHNRQWNASGYLVEPGQIGRVWTVTLVPDSVTRSQIELGYRDNSDNQLPVRWVPEPE